MKTFIAAITLIMMSTAYAATESATEKDTASKREGIGAPPNAVSSGGGEGGISDSPIGTTPRKAEKYEMRTRSMGGAPNVGGGMGTGTGAGSTVGKEVEDAITAGALGGAGEEDE